MRDFRSFCSLFVGLRVQVTLFAPSCEVSESATTGVEQYRLTRDPNAHIGPILGRLNQGTVLTIMIYSQDLKISTA
jgi:hypothetical protein